MLGDPLNLERMVLVLREQHYHLLGQGALSLDYCCHHHHLLQRALPLLLV